MRSHVLFISGRSGVGKSTAALALHETLVEKDIRHAVIEGDYLDLAHPAPHLEFPGEGLSEQNLSRMWQAYKSLGYSRLIYTNTVAVLSIETLTTAMGDNPLVTAVLLQSSDEQAAERLDRRRLGSGRTALPGGNAKMARRLDDEAPASVHRLETGGLTPADVAARMLAFTGWSPGISAAVGSRTIRQ